MVLVFRRISKEIDPLEIEAKFTAGRAQVPHKKYTLQLGFKKSFLPAQNYPA
jgi:hypothetical protein